MTISILAGAVSAILGAAVATYAMRRLFTVQLQAVTRRIEIEVGRQEQETRAAVDRLAQVVAAETQGWFWTPDWQEGEHAADEDLAAGHTVRFESIEDMDTYLDKIPLPTTASGPTR